jgi:glycosyltransferase involved in cell wall biosynthesis
MIGRISPQKRQKEFVLACARLSLDRPDLRFVLSGDVLFGDRRGQSYKCELQGLFPPSLQFLGWTDDVYSVLAELDLLVVPSSGEGGFPRVAMEAFAAGVPVLAHASGAIPEVVVEGQTGFLLKCGSAEEIATRVNELLADRAALQRVATAAHRIWRDRFTSTFYGKQVCTLLRGLIYRS